MFKKVLKGAGVGLGAMLCATLGIFASDAVRGIDGHMNLANVQQSGACVEGMMPVQVGDRTLCVDVYEASPSTKCPHQTPTNVVQTEENAKATDCYAASVKSGQPWVFVSLPQAQRLCAGAGKRLPTNEEWYRSALGTDNAVCTIAQGKSAATGAGNCVSALGIYDTVGNVWEWVDESVTGRSFDGRELPETGYVASVDGDGIAVTSAQAPDVLYDNDYFWSGTDGVYGMIRGGFYGSNNDAGLYTTNASVPTSFASQGVGFRCVSDLR